jgi:HTH-type transcriptional regulator / antitoxin HigA
MPTLKGVGLLKALMEESNLHLNDLIPIFGNEVVVTEVLNAERPLTQSQISQLAEFFRISPAFF